MEHASVKVKEEPTQNKVLRALMSATTEKYHITTGKQAVEMLLTSARIKEVTVIVHTRMVCGFMFQLLVEYHINLCEQCTTVELYTSSSQRENLHFCCTSSSPGQLYICIQMYS